MRWMALAGFVLALLLAQGVAPRVVHAEPFELALWFAPGVGPCFAREELVAATRERLARRAPQLLAGADAPAAIEITLAVAPSAGGWLASITSVRRASGERGVRELAVAAECAGLRDALSLVLALMVEEAARPPAPAPAAPPAAPTVPPPPPAPVRPVSAPVRPRAPAAPDVVEPVRPQLALASGVGLGLAPVALPIVSAGVRLPVTPAQVTILPLFAELDADMFLPRQAADERWRVAITGVGAQAQLCARFARGIVTLDPCAGLWLRALFASGAGAFEDTLAAESFTLAGWDVRGNVAFGLGAGWSLFLSGQVLAPFAEQVMRVCAKPAEPELMLVSVGPGGDPFFNAPGDGDANANADDGPEIVLYRPVELSGVLLAGVALTL